MAVCAAPCCGAEGGTAGDHIGPTVTLQARRFEPGDVRLLPGPFRHAMELDAKVLLALEPDRLLSWYRKEAGLPPNAEQYGGWESQGIAGRSMGPGQRCGCRQSTGGRITHP